MSTQKVVFLNDINRISKNCDCDPYSGPIICPDIGYAVSDDPVAADAASLDLVNKVKPDLFKKTHFIDPSKQLEYGEEVGLGTTFYEFIEI